MTRPVIGICAAIESARWAAWEVVVNLSPRTTRWRCSGPGGIALILPPDDVVAESPDELLDMLDGLILAGGVRRGSRVSYGAQPHPETRGTRPERDRFELALGTRALERDMPRARHLPRHADAERDPAAGRSTSTCPSASAAAHRHTPGVFTDHGAARSPARWRSAWWGASSTEVKSAHHQGVDELGEGVVASG